MQVNVDIKQEEWMCHKYPLIRIATNVKNMIKNVCREKGLIQTVKLFEYKKIKFAIVIKRI